MALSLDSGRTQSIWVPTTPTPPVRPPLSADAACDVAIVGAGIAGLSVAYQLAKAGKTVVVIDDGPVAGGETGRTTGLLGSYIDDGLSDTETKHGTDGLKLAVDSHAAAIDEIERICRLEGIDADFKRLPEYRFVASESSRGPSYLDDEYAAAERIGWHGVTFADRAPIPGVDTGRCLVFPNQGRLHAGKYLAGLAAAAERAGVTIHERTRAQEIGTRSDGRAYVATLAGHTLRADAVVTCTNSPVHPALATAPAIHVRQAPYRTLIVAFDVPAGQVEDALYSDTLDPYHYVRLQEENGGMTLLVGGEDFKTGHADDAEERFDRLEAWTRLHWPNVGRRTYAWTGQVMETEDFLAYIGHTPGGARNDYLVTGDSGMGLTHGTLAGLLIADLILGRDNPWADLYRPSRVKPSALGETLKENLDVAWQYTDLLTGGDVSDPAQITPGHGAVIRRGVSKIACYRAPDGTPHERTAICPHLGGVVRFNSTECTWDCPIHGSRFDPTTGEALNGPAIGGEKEKLEEV